MPIVRNIRAREILDSRGYPTIETEVVLSSGAVGIASVPSGASTGANEAVELRDNDMNRFMGKGVLTAVGNVNNIISEAIVGKTIRNQRSIDDTLIDIDGTENKSKLGANAILSVSLACANAASAHYRMPLYMYIGGISNYRLPKPMMNILNGGAHADNKIDIQEFMIVPSRSGSFKDYVLMCSTIYHSLKKILVASGLSSNIGDEGGVAPNLFSTKEALDLIMDAIKKSGYEPGTDVSIALDIAASGLHNAVDGTYSVEGTNITFAEIIEFYRELMVKYPIISIEDPLHEEAWDSWTALTSDLGESIQIVGDDLYVTNKKKLVTGIIKRASNAILIKPNQIGTLTETLDTINCAKDNGYNIVISHRSGETNDTTISDLAVGVSANYIKTGAPCRGERIAKYNRLLLIEDEINGVAF